MNKDRLKGLYLEYDPDKDPNGSIGIKIADAVFEKFGCNLDKLHVWLADNSNRQVKEKSNSREQQYLDFYKKVENKHLTPSNIFCETNAKRSLIKEVFGYTKLITGKKESTPIEECNPERIGQVFRKMYKTAVNVKKKYSNLHFS